MSVKIEDELLNLKVNEWLEWDKDESTRSVVEKLVAAGDHETLRKIMLKRLEFGTAGLRAAMGAGYSRMNKLTVVQTTQGLCKYLSRHFYDLKTRGVVIGHDARHSSYSFARLTAAVFLSAGVKTYLFSDIVPTPYVPFSVLKYGCAAGVMVTASHNPKEDNGYKVYFSNGAQIIPPHDSGIAQSILDNLRPVIWDEEMTSELCIDPLDEVHKDYMQTIQKHCHYRSINEGSDLNITYTAMHGVGAEYEREAFKAFSLKPFFTTPAQDKPDPEFPTVRLPNPEEGKGALKLAMETAEENKSPFIISNDPDADRLAIAEKLQDGTWKIFTGNETAVLLGWWAFHNHHKTNAHLYPGDNVYMVYSTVSSRVLRTMAEIEGFKCEDTLTGFKWMGNKAIDLKAQGKTVLFAFEEAIGFMFGDQVLDKDGISAGAIVSEMACFIYHQGLTMAGKLHQLYKKYGYHVSNNSYYICYDQPTIEKIFTRIRSLNDGQFPEHVGPYKILHVRDLYGEGYDSSRPHNKPVLPTSTAGQMMTFTFEHGYVATIRTSGTEPKIKYYSESYTRPKDGKSQSEAQKELDDLIKHLVEELLQPEVNKLIPRTS